MLICSIKASTVKFFCCIACALVIAVTLTAFLPGKDSVTTFTDGKETVYDNAETNGGRIEFLKQFGWEVESTPIEKTTVTVPSEFDTVFSGYNDLQKLQGLDLSRYKQKEVTRYTYKIINYSGYQGTVYANLIVYRGCVIGGDVCTESSDGFIHGFSKDTRL